MKVAIILHNLIIDVEGEVSGASFAPLHTTVEEDEDAGAVDEEVEADQEEVDGERKRQRLIAELLAYRYAHQANGGLH